MEEPLLPVIAPPLHCPEWYILTTLVGRKPCMAEAWSQVGRRVPHAHCAKTNSESEKMGVGRDCQPCKLFPEFGTVGGYTVPDKSIRRLVFGAGDVC